MTTLSAPPNSLQASLIEALAGPQPERALEQAFLQLSRGGDLALLLAMVKALVRAGMAGLAVHLIHATGGLLTAEPQIAALLQQLEKLPSGEISRSLLQQRLNANVNALLSENRHLESLRSQLETLGSEYRVFQSAQGNLHAIRHSGERKLEFVFGFTDHAHQAAAATLPSVEVGASWLLLGVPSVDLWNRLVGLRSSNGFIPPIDVIEPDAPVLSLWLAMLKPDDALIGERVAVFAGSEADAEYERFLLDHAWRLPPTHWITNHRPRWKPPQLDRCFGERVAKTVNDRRCKAKAMLDAKYADKHSAYWAHRFATAGASSPPLRIIGFTTRFSTVIQYSMRDLAAAFARRGCCFDIVKEPNAHAASVRIADEILQRQPDMIVVINHLRREYQGAMPANIPYVCWVQDHMPAMWNKEAGKSVTELDLLVGHARDVMVSLYGYPHDRFIPTSNLTSPQTFSAEPIPASELEPYRCDVSYAGHGSDSPEQLIASIAGDNRQFAGWMNHLLCNLQRRLDEQGCVNTMELLTAVLESERATGQSQLTPEIRRTVVIPAAQQLLDRVLRHQTLEWTARWAMSRNRKFRIYGKGWTRHPLFSQFACGELEHGEPLRRMYQASAISLQVNGYSSLHQRLLDGLACGAFMVTRYNPSDFTRNPHAAISRIIESQRIESLNELMAFAKNDSALSAALKEAEELVGTRLAPMTDARRASHVNIHLQCASLTPADFTDEGLFTILRTLKSIPHRVAGDIPGFSQTTFRTEQELHSLLDRYVDDAGARHEIVGPMRQSVLENDTYDALAEKILAAFYKRS